MILRETFLLSVYMLFFHLRHRTAKRISYVVSSGPDCKINLAGEHRCFHLPNPLPYEESHVLRCGAYYVLMCTKRTSEKHGYQQALKRLCTWHSGIIGQDGPHSLFVRLRTCLLAIIPPSPVHPSEPQPSTISHIITIYIVKSRQLCAAVYRAGAFPSLHPFCFVSFALNLLVSFSLAGSLKTSPSCWAHGGVKERAARFNAICSLF